jgi:hypothetical protein
MGKAVDKARLLEVFPQMKIIDWDDIEVAKEPKDWEQQLWQFGYGCGLLFGNFK